MDFLFIEYRDPLFSIIMLLLVVFVVSYANYLWGVFRKKDGEKRLGRFLQGFQPGKKSEEYKEVLYTRPDSLHSLALLASVYSRSGEYDEAVRIYLALLDFCRDKEEKTELMFRLGKTYYKAGFLQRSREILLQALERKARNPEALELLAVIGQRMKKYDEAAEALAALQEMGRDTSRERAALEGLKIVEGAPEGKTEKLLALYREHPFLERMVFETLFATDRKAAWENLPQEGLENLIDLFWQLDRKQVEMERAERIPFLAQLYTAKGWSESAQDSPVFELDVLIKMGKARESADLGFEYACEKCRSLFPLPFVRCPSCMAAGTVRVQPVLAKKNLGGAVEESANFY